VTLRLALGRKRRDLRGPLENSQRVWSEREWLILSLSDSEGHAGVGEAAPLPGYSDETLEVAERAITEWAKTELGPGEAWIERGVADPRALLESLSTLSSVRAPSARFALETALLDLVSQRREETLHQFLALVTAAPQREIEGLPLAQLISQANAEAEAAAALELGFTTLKLKIGTSIGFPEELATLTRLRARFGSAFRLRLDCNQKFTHAEASAHLAALLPLGIEFVEEPLAAHEPRLETPVVPLALDESLRKATNLEPTELARQGIRVLVLKPSVLGGFCATLAFVARAQQLGLDWVLSHTFESAVGYRALTAFALALGPTRLAHGLGPHGALDCAPESLGIRAGKLWAVPLERK
jgi:L-Ala-D/L-Glu epimerase